MDELVRHTVEDCTAGSDAGTLSFPQVVARLLEAGVERYHADLRRAEKTYYLPDGDSYVVDAEPLPHAPAQAFAADGVASAVRTIQGGKISYREFSASIAAAGCVGYLVSLLGRRVVYYGRTAELHIEPFPSPR